MGHLPLTQQNEVGIEILQEMSPVLPHSGAFFSGRISLPPGINHQHQIVYVYDDNGEQIPRIADSAAMVQFKERAGWELKLASIDKAVVEAIKTNRKHIHLSVRIRYFFKTMWRRDIDGGDKAVIDAVFRHLQLNDNLICDLHVTKDVDRDDPHVEVEVRCMFAK